MYDLNDAQPQMAPAGDLIPDGTFARVRMTIRPGGVNGSSPLDAGLLTASKSSDAKMLDCEFTVVEGAFARRKFWQNFTVAGGKLDDKGVSKGWNIAKAAFRAMVDSALGLDPKDMSDAAKAKRTLRGLKDLDGITFVARIMVEPASSPQYKDANKLAHVVTPDEPQHSAVLRGEAVPPEPVNAKPRKAAEPAAQGGPAWATTPPAANPNAGAAWNTSPAAPATAPAWAGQTTAPASPPPAAPPAGPAWLNG
ncbi:hypothetical protein [Rhodospirillum centenum]|uniref:Uncharacterized protein n=1 Tax=Rhodospirillum centenum (strain ATCC 51521 / SW) TaxID=414684 RepID=B6IPW1_RHOCS|nr:hypothetical protein [Rhodospirillum centenum]ACI97497.1 conserved hypothetical protein [Rhodospirillum centenum SW]